MAKRLLWEQKSCRFDSCQAERAYLLSNTMKKLNQEIVDKIASLRMRRGFESLYSDQILRIVVEWFLRLSDKQEIGRFDSSQSDQGAAVQPGVDISLSRRRSWVQIPSASPNF